MTKIANFDNFRWRTAAILKIIIIIPCVSRNLSDFDEIWCADTNFDFDDCQMTKINILQIQDG